MTEDTKTVVVDGDTWEVRADGTLAGSPLSEEDSRSAWEVFRFMKREHLARGLTPPPDPLTACVRVAYGAILSHYGGIDRGEEPLQ